MAGIGNLLKLKEWNEDPSKAETAYYYRVAALEMAIKAGQLECMKYLANYIAEHKQSTFYPINSSSLLLQAVENDAYGEWGCVAYLIEEYKDILIKTKREAIIKAAAEGQLAIVRYFIEKCEGISAGGKGQALICAAIGTG